MEDVKFGIYPLTAFAMATPVPAIEIPPSPESKQTDKTSEEKQQDEENRRIQKVIKAKLLRRGSFEVFVF